jgi:6-pyruvoyltetrahydropterin/6-carboxytetrahydropterin synthase
MDIELTKDFRFEAAHWLPTFPEGHKCTRLHGHSFRVRLVVRGPVDPTMGVLIDYGDIKRIAGPIIDGLDHHCLNHLGEARQEPLLANPTAENLARWIFEQVSAQLPLLYQVIVFETCTTRCVYPAR